MCEECGIYGCSPSCPSYSGQRVDAGRLYGTCSECGRLIYLKEKSVRKCGTLVCQVCAEQANVRDTDA